MSERAFHIVGLTGHASGDRRLDAAVRAALGGADGVTPLAFFLDYPAVADGIRQARFRSHLDASSRAALETLEAAAGLVIGVPIERGTIPGQFKHLLDLADPERLRGKPALVFTHVRDGDDIASIRQQVTFLTDSFGLDLPHDLLTVDRSQFASDGRLLAEDEQRFARAGRLLAIALSTRSSSGPATTSAGPDRRLPPMTLVR